MKNKILGPYNWPESLLSVAFFSLLAYINYLFFKTVLNRHNVSEIDFFMILAIDIMGLLIVSLPYLKRKAECLSSKKVEIFLDLPKHDAKINFSSISRFLGDQALASFLATVLIFTGKAVFEAYGGVLTAFYIIPFSCIAIMLASISLIRFITHFTKLSGFVYGIASTLSAGVMFAFFNVGLRLGS